MELIYTKGYQSFDTVSSVVTTKVKGQGFLPINQTLDIQNKNSIEYVLNLNPNVSYKIIDPADYVIPPNDMASIFIMTNFIKTEQSQGELQKLIDYTNTQIIVLNA